MPRVARVVIADASHHVTQGRKGRQFLLASDPERRVYLDLLEISTWRKSWSEASWRKFLEEREREFELRVIRRRTHTGRPLGSAEFTEALEPRMGRRLIPGKGGRPRKPERHETQRLPSPTT